MIKITRVAIVDDDEEKRASLSEYVLDANFEPVIFTKSFRRIEHFIEEIKTSADAAICDHRLQTRKYANFFGAEAVSALYQERIPAILITSWQKVDEDLMRPFRSRIPVLIARENLSCERIQKAFEICAKEIEGEMLPSRKTWRTLIRIEGIVPVGNIKMVDVIIPAWNPNEGVRLPLELLKNLKRLARPGQRFFARVNTGAMDSADLFFENFELAPKPNKEL